MIKPLQQKGDFTRLVTEVSPISVKETLMKKLLLTVVVLLSASIYADSRTEALQLRAQIKAKEEQLNKLTAELPRLKVKLAKLQAAAYNERQNNRTKSLDQLDEDMAPVRRSAGRAY